MLAWPAICGWKGDVNPRSSVAHHCGLAAEDCGEEGSKIFCTRFGGCPMQESEGNQQRTSPEH